MRDASYAAELNDSLRRFIGTQGSINISHENNTLTINITYPSDASAVKDSGSLAAFLKDEGITIDTVQNNSIKGWKGGWLW